MKNKATVPAVPVEASEKLTPGKFQLTESEQWLYALLVKELKAVDPSCPASFVEGFLTLYALTAPGRGVEVLSLVQKCRPLVINVVLASRK